MAFVTYRGQRLPRHSAIYLEFFDAYPGDWLPCELCPEDEKKGVVNTHHIYARGMGGDISGEKDMIENLMGLCYQCHAKCEAEVISKENQLEIHLGFIRE